MQERSRAEEVPDSRLVYSPPPYGLDSRMGTSGGVQRRPLVRADAGRGVAALTRSMERAETSASWEYCDWVCMPHFILFGLAKAV